MKEACEEGQFLADVKLHKMTVFRDEGVNRHIRFSQPNRGAYYFDLITWHGHLCITGDCGTYVFSRLRDMFEFFRTDRTESPEKLFINAGYWGEKLQSVCVGGGYREFDTDAFESRVRDFYNAWVDAERPTEDEADELWEEIESDVLSPSYDGEYPAYEAARSFCYGRFEFVDFFDGGGTQRYTHSYLWCLYAIAWGIQQYDKKS